MFVLLGGRGSIVPGVPAAPSSVGMELLAPSRSCQNPQGHSSVRSWSRTPPPPAASALQSPGDSSSPDQPIRARSRSGSKGTESCGSGELLVPCRAPQAAPPCPRVLGQGGGRSHPSGASRCVWFLSLSQSPLPPWLGVSPPCAGAAAFERSPAFEVGGSGRQRRARTSLASPGGPVPSPAPAPARAAGRGWSGDTGRAVSLGCARVTELCPCH